MRTLQMGMATASQWLFNFVVAKATPSMFATLGVNGFGTYFVYGSFCFAMVIFTWFLVPETNGECRIPRERNSTWLTFLLGLSLEDMNSLFAQHNVRAKFTPSRLTTVEGFEANKDLKLDVAKQLRG